MSNAIEVTVLYAIPDHAFDCCGNRTPGTAEQFGDRVPGQQLGPFGQKAAIGTGQPLFAGHPGKLLRANTTAVGTVHPTGLISKPHRNIP